MNKFVWVVIKGADNNIEIVFSKYKDAINYVDKQILTFCENSEEKIQPNISMFNDEYYGDWKIMFTMKIKFE